jgi:hypothetical protein
MQFMGNHVKIMWALAFMKSGWAAHFVDCQMCAYHDIRSLSYQSWQEFVDKFIIDFCPKNKVQTLRTELETLRFFQGGQDVDEYVNDFHELIQHAQYFEGAHIALKF